MTDAIHNVALTIFPGTTPTLVDFQDVPLGDSEVSQIIIVFPPGCSGLVGAAVQYSLNPVYPSNAGGYFVFDDYTIAIPVTNQETGGQWRVVGYNQDINNHVIQFYFYYDY